MRARGFTLIELLVVIAIIAILAAILFPVFARAREKARQASCQSNCKQIALGLLMYSSDFDEAFPGTYQKMGQAADWPLIIWRDLISPYVKNTQLFQCPSDLQTGNTSYGANTRVMPDSRVDFNSKIGGITHPAETLLMFDQWQGGYWCADGNWFGGRCSATCFGGKAAGIRFDGVNISRHNDGFNAAFCDGHVKWEKGGTADWDQAKYWQKVR